LAELPLDLEMPAVHQPPVRSDRSTDEKIDALVNGVFDLVSRVDATQRQLDSLQLAAATDLSTDQASADLSRHRFQGAIPRRALPCLVPLITRRLVCYGQADPQSGRDEG
jgi:hypothetical protein